MTLVSMSVKGLMLDPITNAPVVLLQDEEETTFLPIWVGVFEANAIALQLEGVETPRPMTHDLLRDLLRQLDATVSRIVINDLKDSTFYAQIHLETASGARTIDARPSDALALALRTQSPIYVDDAVLENAQKITPPDEEEAEKSKSWFESLNPDDLSKYKM
jgi:uncharacterized protein